MDQKYTDNTPSNEVKRIIEEIDYLHQNIHFLKGRIESIQRHCKHIFLETPGMRKCHKCGFAESTYY